MINPQFSINGLMIGYDHSPVIIAEIGINHEGCLKTAKEMVDAALLGGAHIIKHQTHVVEDEMTSEARKVIPGNADVSIYEIMERCALSEEEEYELMNYVTSQGGIFISTPFSRAAANRLRKFDVPAYKIGSGECNNYPLIEHIASFGKPIILSTGMNNIESVRISVEIFRRYKIPFALLHTTNLYPTPPELVRLGAIQELQEAFPDAVLGLSDHTTNNLACFGAVALGASILERHFTDSMDRKGPDILCSMDTNALKELVEGSRILKLERGGNKSTLLQEEQVTRDFAYATVVSIQNIPKGALLTKENIWVKRPGTGAIQAKDFNNLLGKKTSRDIPRDSHLSWEDFE